MCGLFGVVRLDGQPLELPDQALEHMRNALLHRGPNGSWHEIHPSAAMGLTRLAIRGLDDGRQPLVDETTGVMVVCNGEIDNHGDLRDELASEGITVTQQTDIAVILPLYLRFGSDFVDKLTGAFAIALWDPRQAALHLYRDRTGERPLFYGHDDSGQVWFASELAAFPSAMISLNAMEGSAVRDYLRSGYFPAPVTPYHAIRKVAPGETIALTGEGEKKKLYWSWTHHYHGSSRPKGEDFDAIFRGAVSRQSEVDVDFGLFLSGGLDSSLIAAVLKDVYPEKVLNSYTIRFGDASYDEGAFAQSVADHVGIPCHEIWITPEHFPALLPQIVAGCREPLADPAWVPSAALAQRASQDIKVALVGEGADEVFAGYPTYFGAALAQHYDHLPALARRGLRTLVERWPVSDKKVSLSFLLKRFVQGEGMNPLARHRLWTASIAPSLLDRLGLPEGQAAFDPAPPPLLPEHPAAPLDLLQCFDLRYLLGESLLTKADRASMHAGLELRAPYLDREVLDFARHLPPDRRIHGITTKVFLKDYALKYLPSSIVHRKKRGLSVPLGSWLRDELHDWAHTLLSHESLQRLGLDREAMLLLLEKHRKKQEDHARPLWTLMVLATWMQTQGSPEG